MNMKKTTLLAVLTLAAATTFAQMQQDPDHYVEYSDWSQLKQHKIPEWFKDAKFGIYAHLGPYCVPAFGNEWYVSQMYKNTNAHEHHVETYGELDKFGYKDFIPMFKAEKFDAAEWAELFKNSGAKFAGTVTIHHDGFAMWDSEINPWNAMDMGPQQDIYGDLAREIKKRDMKLVATFHHGINHTSYYQDEAKPNDLNDPEAKYLYGRIGEKEANERWFEQIKEVIDAYQPDQIWFDFDIRAIDDPMKNKFATYYYSKEKEWEKELIITRKNELFPAGVGVLDVERGSIDRMHDNLWQTDDAIAVNSWCWVENLKLKTPKELIHQLVDIVSKNGVLLLNACPKADGTIPEDQQEIFLEIGKFLEINGEAIYSTRPFKIHGAGKNLYYGGRGLASTSSGMDTYVEFDSGDIRYTESKDGRFIYVFAMGWPEDGLMLGEFKKMWGIKNVELLGSDSKIEWEQTADGLSIKCDGVEKPENMCAYAWKISVR